MANEFKEAVDRSRASEISRNEQARQTNQVGPVPKCRKSYCDRSGGFHTCALPANHEGQCDDLVEWKVG